MRVVKEREVRRGEILDIAEELFNTKGYANTSIGDILQKAGIARGTLYYHFESKEEILNAVIDRQLDVRAAALQKIANSDTSVLDKIYKMIELQISFGVTLSGLHDIENAQFHQKSFTHGVARFSPIYSQVIVEGVIKKVFDVAHPKEAAELLLCASLISDPGYFTWTEAELRTKAEAVVCLMERALGAESGYFAPLLPLFIKQK